MNVAIIPDDKDGSPSAMTAALTRDPICAVLRKAREQAGYDIVDIAQLLRIQRNYLEAIEEGRYGDLPGTVYAIGFVRTYSDFLNLDTSEMVRRFKEEALELSKRTDYVFPVPPTEARVPGMGVLVVGVLLAALAYGVWYVSSSGEERLVDMASSIPDRFAELAARGGDPEPSGTATSEPSADTMAATPAPTDAATATGSSATPPDLDQLAALAAPRPEAAEVPMAATAPTPAESPSSVELESPEEIAPARTDPAPVVPIETVEEAPVAPAAPPQVAAAAPADPVPPAPSPVQPNEPIETVQNVEPIRRVPPPLGGESPADQFEVAAAPGVSPNGLPKANTGPSADGPTNILPTGRSTVATAPPPPPPAVQPGQTRRNGLGNLNSRIQIRATEMSWVQITDDLGNLVMTRVLDPGETYRVPNTEGLTLASGNAGGLEVLIDGVAQGPLGLRGTVVRNVALDPDNFGTQ